MLSYNAMELDYKTASFGHVYFDFCIFVNTSTLYDFVVCCNAVGHVAVLIDRCYKICVSVSGLEEF